MLTRMSVYRPGKKLWGLKPNAALAPTISSKCSCAYISLLPEYLCVASTMPTQFC